jgi:hypothetical protein
MTTEIDDADDVFAIALAGREPVTVDLFCANDAFNAELDGWQLDKDAAAGGKADAMRDYYRRVQAAAESLGFAGASGTTAERIRRAVLARLEAARKKAEGSSPATTP